ncbi:peptidoglycan-binding protein [Nonomuraea sp. 10N515B]|uniref:peptidoglycan-binding protein n=1 Tax=Nonomuraea sp. 10N515B TaxID=3457422 RepID=UPI003FCE27A5
MLLSGVAVIGSGAVVGFMNLPGRTAAPASSPNGAQTSSVPITRSDMVDTKQVSGTLGYAGRRIQPNRASGVVTATRAEGTVVRRGGWLYKVEGKPVFLMYGAVPMYRRLGVGTTGPDVQQLELNLVKLGYKPGTVDKTFTAVTAQAVWAWQRDKGLVATGRAEVSQVIFSRGALRIAENTKEAGDAAEGSVVTTTRTERAITIKLETSNQQFARKGARVRVQLPDGKKVAGTISSVGTIARPGKDADSPATIDVSVKVGGELGRLDQAPVTVELRTGRRKDVLSVPVEALIAREGGQYGVRVVQGGTRQVVPVETGLFTGSRVEISGAGLSEGVRVEVPRL